MPADLAALGWVPPEKLAEAATKPTNALALDAKVRRAYQLRSRVERLKKGAEATSAEYARLVRSEIPELLTEIGTSVWAVDDLKVAIGTRVAGSLGKAPDEDAAVGHLRDLGFVGAIETVMTVSFSEDERTLCDAVSKAVAASTGHDVDYARSVHHSTLAAFAAERMREGLPVNLGILGLSAWREASIKRGK